MNFIFLFPFTPFHSIISMNLISFEPMGNNLSFEKASNFAFFFLVLAMIGYWISLIFPKSSLPFKISGVLVLLANLLFIFTLGGRWIQEKYFPLSNLYESLIFLTWGISSIHIYLERQTRSRLIGALISPFLVFLSGFSTLTLPIEMQKALPLVPSLQSNWLMMHVSMMMISYSTLMVGSLFSILYLFFFKFKKEKEIKQEFGIQNLSVISQSSSMALLEILDIWSYRIIGLGFPFLTIGIISGAVWANEAWGSYWSWDPKETWALITWLIFAIYLHSRLLKGWQGQKTAFLGSLGFFITWICYLGVNFLGKGLHSYGWIS
jgi:cytochrome c-type biogenesis protein CcsB